MSNSPESSTDDGASDSRRWYHIIVTTYGAWLYGDQRGFRTRHHREHVEGDYRNPPPPEKFANKRRFSQRALKGAPVVFASPLRPIVGFALKERLEELGAFVLTLSVGGQHVHVQAQTENGEARRWTGLAKKHVWHVLCKECKWKGRLWGKRSKAILIRDREHQRNVHRYILDHAQEGAWTWCWVKRRDEHSS